jgi:hypothetical protein
MGKVLEHITDELIEWVGQQQMFFVASAPRSDDGHINCSPKGIDSFRILGPHRVAYQDLTGSGVETIAHLRENGRILIMFCAFAGGPRIVRFHGTGTFHRPGEAGFDDLSPRFHPHPGTRAIVDISVTRVSTSCGYSVPEYHYLGQRDVLDKWTDAKGPDGLNAYRAKKNAHSIDGLPGLDVD